MEPKPFSHPSERLFAEYLDRHGLQYERDFVVSPGDVDFLVTSKGLAYCEVKAIVQPPKMHGRIEAQDQIRKDIRNFRQKFEGKPDQPCVLVTMNYSPQMFTGLTIRTAMLGDVAITFAEVDGGWHTSPMHHRPRDGKPAMHRKQNTSISGVFVLDGVFDGHMLFSNPYAKRPLPEGFFPEVRHLQLGRDDGADQMGDESRIEFFPCNLAQPGG